MKTPTRRLLMQPLFWALVFGSLIAYGVYAYWQIPVEVLPRFNFPQIAVIVHQPGATAAELETQIAWPLESNFLALPNLQDVRSTMGNGTVETDIRFQPSTEAQQDLLAVESAISRAAIPAAAHPVAEIMGNAINEIADYSLELPASVEPAAARRALLTNVVPALRALPGVYRVEVYGAGDEALWVQPNLAALVRNGVPVTALVEAIGQQVLLRPGGYLSLGHQDSFIEVRNLPVQAADWERIPVAGPHGPIPLGDLARVIRAPLPTLNAVLLDRRPSLALTVFKQPGASTVPVSQSVKAALQTALAQLPPGVRWVNIYDQGRLVHIVGADLGRNLLIGG
ncbi:MAG: efflux RND transporter permease subunit, partial [Terriglobales bacterium]